MTRTTKIIIGIVALLVLVLVVGVIMGGPSKSTEVQTEAVARRTIVEMVSASGKIQPETEVKITSEVSGQIIALPVKEGDVVEKGALLLQINPDLYESQLNRTVAALNSARSNLANSKARLAQVNAQFTAAKLAYERNKKLYDQGAISQAEWDNAQSTYQTAEAEVSAGNESVKSAEFAIKSSEATMVEASDNLKRTTILAPQTGTVTALTKEIGESVLGNQMMAGEVIMKISDLNIMEVDVEVNESDIVRVSLGDTVDVEVDAYRDDMFKGVVTEIGNTALNSMGSVGLSMDQVTNFSVKIRILESSYAKLAQESGHSPFRPGMSATVEIATETVRDVLSIPIKAVTTRQDTSARATRFGKKEVEEDQEPFQVVFVESGGRAQIRVVKMGIQDTKYKQVLTGLNEDEIVITGPYDQVSKSLKAGQMVKAKEKDKEEK